MNAPPIKMRPQEHPLLRLWNAVKPPPPVDRRARPHPDLHVPLIRRFWKAIAFPGRFTPLQLRAILGGFAAVALVAAIWGVHLYAAGTARRAAAQMQAGLDLMAGGHAQEALDHFDRAIGAKRSADAYFQRALAYISLNSVDSAIADLNAVIRLDPKFARAYLERGKLFEVNTDFPKAIADFSKALGLSASADGYHLRAQAYAAQLQYQKALDDLNNAIRLGPDVPEFYRSRSMVRRDMGDRKGAEADRKTTLALERIDPKRAKAHRIQASAHR